MLRTSVPVSVWVDEGDRVIATAWHLLDEADRKARTREDPEGRQMSG